MQIPGKSFNKDIVSQAYFHRGSAHFIQRDYNKAIVDYDAAIRLNPSYLKAYHIRGNAYFLQGAYEKAIADFDKVVQLDPTYKAVTFYRQFTRKKLRQKKLLEQKD